MPAIAEPASQEYHVGKVILQELVTPDLAAAKRFYAGLFGWTYQDIALSGSEYAQAYLDGHPVAGLVQKAPPSGVRAQPLWLSFIAARDVDMVKTIAVEHGAKVLRAPHDIPGRGREAYFADPQGATFGVLASSSGDPPDVLPSPGEWIWSSLITKDPDSDAAFYQTLFGYEVFEDPGTATEMHVTLAADDYARGSINSLPPERPSLHPHWLNFIRVEDADRAAAKAVELGGHILVAPRIDRHGGRMAVVSDPAGAPFGLLEWADDHAEGTR